MGGAMLWQSHLTPPSPGMDPAQQKMMRCMPVMFLLFLYNYSSGMALYMTVSKLLSVLQTKLTKNLRDPAAPAAGPATNPALTPAVKKEKIIPYEEGLDLHRRPASGLALGMVLAVGGIF